MNMSSHHKTAITILGATGSIGLSTLDVISRHLDRFSVFALTAYQQIERLADLCLRFQPVYAVVAKQTDAVKLQQRFRIAAINTEVLYGEEALCHVAQANETDAVMAAIVGAAGLLPTLSAAQAGKTIYLANKETLVVAGALFMQAVQQSNAQLLPVDSEHNAIYQVLPTDYQGDLVQAGIASLILTASGGPFLHTPLSDFARIIPEEAVKHPNWSMGQKISVDSATMMNKGLELIEAHWLFNAPAKQLEVIIHPQSVVHSMVRYIDGSVLAQMGEADMRIPIAHCLGLTQRINSGAKQLDFTRLNGLNFLAADFNRFPCLKLAYEVLHSSNDASACILNAANEIAVGAFLHKLIGFMDIARVVDSCLQLFSGHTATDIKELLELDQQVRMAAENWIRTHTI